MWPFRRKKPDPRHTIHWQATMKCSFPEHQEMVPVEVLEISTKGARLQIKKLQVGPYHLFVSDPAARFSLLFALPEGSVEAPMQLLWYNLHEEKRVFLVDVDFTGMSDVTKTALKKAIKRLAQTPTEEPPAPIQPSPKAEPGSLPEAE